MVAGRVLARNSLVDVLGAFGAALVGGGFSSCGFSWLQPAGTMAQEISPVTRTANKPFWRRGRNFGIDILDSGR
jgi:hypothetical protein